MEKTKEQNPREVKKDIPKCPKCGKKYVEAYDRIAKRKTGYLWKATCKCAPKNWRLSVG